MVATHGEALPLGPHVDQPVEVPQGGQRLALLVRPHERLCDHVLVQQRHDRHPDTRQPADFGGVNSPAFTTTSAAIAPSSVRTPRTRPRSTTMPVTRVPVITWQPRRTAPSARARQRRDGSMYPSLGRKEAPRTPVMSSRGNDPAQPRARSAPAAARRCGPSWPAGAAPRGARDSRPGGDHRSLATRGARRPPAPAGGRARPRTSSYV